MAREREAHAAELAQVDPLALLRAARRSDWLAEVLAEVRAQGGPAPFHARVYAPDFERLCDGYRGEDPGTGSSVLILAQAGTGDCGFDGCQAEEGLIAPFSVTGRQQ